MRETLDTIQTEVGVGQYSLEATGSQQQVARVLHVSVNGSPVEVVPSERVGSVMPASGSPVVAYTTREGSEYYLNLYPTPDAVVPVKVLAAVRPMRSATSLDDDLYHRWFDAIVYGAASRLMAIPGQSFSDPQLAVMYTARAISAANKARIEGSYNRTRGQIAVRANPLA